MSDNSKYLSILFDDPDLLENELATILGCKDTCIFDQGDKEGYIDIDDIVEIEYKNKCWGIYYFLEYGPLDKYAIFELENQAIFGYQYFKKKFQNNPIIFHDRDYPCSKICVGYNKKKLSKKFIKDFYDITKFVSNFFYGNATSQSVKNEFIEKFFSELTFTEYLDIQDELEYVGYCIHLKLLGFNRNESNLLSLYEKENLRVTLSEIFSFEITTKQKIKAELYIELNDYLIIVFFNQKYIVEKEGYTLIRYLVDKYNQPYEDGTEISFFITDKYELIIYSSVFSVIQRAYIVENYKHLVEAELKGLEKNILLLKKENYFEIDDIIKSFEKLINCSETKENELEEFIKINFRVILGKEYTKIRTQIMVNLFSKDNQEERRFDIFAFNSASKEWELFELKRAKSKITKQVRGIPMFNSIVNDGIAQLRHYKNLLSQGNIRQSLKENYEIDVRVPRFTLIIGIGNSSDIKICQNEVTDVRIMTYSQLAETAKIINNSTV